MESPLAAFSFLLLTLFVALGLLHGINFGLGRAGYEKGRRIRILWITFGLMLLWLTAVSAASLAGFYSVFTLPPRIPLFAALPPLVFIFFLFNNRKFSSLLVYIPPAWPVLFQGFRIWVEVNLWIMFREGLFPGHATFEGYNADIIAGATAPVFSYLVFQKSVLPKYAAVAWNIFSLMILLATIAVIALSAPLPFRVFMQEPSTAMLAEFPFIFLPGFLVPSAVLLHAVSLRQLLMKTSQNGH